MGSKKHKKESKKKKHRSRSRSPLDGEERERKRHKKHKDRKKERSPDIEEVPVDSHLRPRSRSPSVELDSRARDSRSCRSNDDDLERGPRDKSASPAAGNSGGGAQESLSIEETNRLRAKLGLKPLEMQEKPADDGKFKDDLGEFYHAPAANISQQKKAEKLRDKLEERREKRKIEQKLQTKLLGEASDDEDASAWVRKSRQLQQEKEEAAKRAAMLDEMDEVFGVAALVAEDAQAQRDAAYSARDLDTLRVAHDFTTLDEEKDIILTLADKPVLGDDAEDVLVNVNIADDEKAKKNIIQRKKARTGYQAYDDEADFEMLALGLQKPVLAKYDDEIDPKQDEKKKGFRIGDQDAIEASRFREMMLRERLKSMPGKQLESLLMPEPQLAANYLSPEEVKFKKVKRKGKLRQRTKTDAIDVEAHDAGNLLITDDTDVKLELVGGVLDEEEVEPDPELQGAIQRALRAQQQRPPQVKVEDILSSIKEEEPQATGDEMVLDATAEFCRSLGDIPTYGLAPNRDHRQEIMDFEEEPEPELAEEAAGAWSRVDPAADKPAQTALPGANAGLEAEPCVGTGVAGALRLALSKGYLERGAGARPAPAASSLPAANYTIADKSAGDEDKGRGRERAHCGPLQEFREKPHFRPVVKLDYVDDDGRPLKPKEAFRYLSHKFHGKGPGKNKQEKRLNKANQEALMKKMSSTDTPLNTLQMLQEKQKETQSPYIVLSGAKRDNK